MNTWEKLSVKHDRMLGGYSVVVGRGMSVAYLCDHPALLHQSARVIIVNDWGRHREYGAIHYTPKWLHEHEKKMTCFINKDPRYVGLKRKGHRKGRLPHVRSDNGTLKVIKRNFNGGRQHDHSINPGLLDKVWKSTDHGIMAVMWAASDAERMFIAGIDFWETPYWPEDCNITKDIRKDAQHKKWRQSVSKTRGATDIMIDFLRACDSCEFHIHTLSPTFRAALEELMKTSDHVNLI